MTSHGISFIVPAGAETRPLCHWRTVRVGSSVCLCAAEMRLVDGQIQAQGCEVNFQTSHSSGTEHLSVSFHGSEEAYAMPSGQSKNFCARNGFACLHRLSI